MARVSKRSAAIAAPLFLSIGLAGAQASDGPPALRGLTKEMRIQTARAPAEVHQTSQGPRGVANKAPARAEDQHPSHMEKSGTIGTGFFVSSEGHLITNAHVVEGCNAPKVTSGASSKVSARVLDRDALNDLALIKGDLKPAATMPLRAGVKIGEAVATFGYPLFGLLSTRGNFTTGNISAITGVGDDSRFLQMTAPVQLGNSGGPMLDQAGNVVGVVLGKLNALEVAATTKDVPQNVNFAIKTSMVMNFLDANGINYATASVGPSISYADIADRARAISVLIECEK